MFKKCFSFSVNVVVVAYSLSRRGENAKTNDTRFVLHYRLQLVVMILSLK